MLECRERLYLLKTKQSRPVAGPSHYEKEIVPVCLPFLTETDALIAKRQVDGGHTYKLRHGAL